MSSPEFLPGTGRGAVEDGGGGAPQIPPVAESPLHHASHGPPPRTGEELGVRVNPTGAIFTVRAPGAESVWLCLFDDAETRHAMTRIGENWTATVEGITPGQRYGYRAAGPGPHDETKLLVDPYATTLDRRFAWHSNLAIPGAETAPLVPKVIVTAPLDPVRVAPAYFHEGG